MTNPQTKQDKLALDAAWKTHPQVVAFRAAVAAHVADHGLTGPAGATAALQFAAAWQAANGPLPDSGILCD